MPRSGEYKVVELMEGNIPRYAAMCRATESFAALAWRDRHIVDNPLMRWLRTLDQPPQEKVLLGGIVPIPCHTAVAILRFRREEIAKMDTSKFLHFSSNSKLEIFECLISIFIINKFYKSRPFIQPTK